jgi:hypothetical protein
MENARTFPKRATRVTFDGEEAGNEPDRTEPSPPEDTVELEDDSPMEGEVLGRKRALGEEEDLIRENPFGAKKGGLFRRTTKSEARLGERSHTSEKSFGPGAMKSVRDILKSIENPDWAGKAVGGRIDSPTLPVHRSSLASSTRLRPAFTSLLTQSFERSNPRMGRIASTILANIFTPLGIFILYRFLPLMFYVFAPMAVFCPASVPLGTTLCGSVDFFGLLDSYYVLSILFMLFFGFSFLYVIFECSVYWIDRIQRLARSEATRRLKHSLLTMMNVAQQKELGVAAVPPARVVVEQQPTNSTGLLLSLPGAVYYLFGPLFVLFSELHVLLRSPFGLSSSRFFGDYEIFRTFVFGSGMGVFGLIMSVLFLVESAGIGLVGYCLLIVSGLLLLANILFAHQFAADDGSSFFSAFIACHYIPSHAPDMIIEESGETEDIGDCPFYRTMRYRERIDFRGEGKLKDFQVAQMVNIFKKHCQIKELRFSVKNKISQTASAILCSCLHNGHMESVELINRIEVKELPFSNQLVLTPDVIRVLDFFRPNGDTDLVPWDKGIRWQHGFWWIGQESVGDNPPVREYFGFPFTVSVALSLVDPFKLIEIDLGSNELGDEVVAQLAQVVLKAVNLVYFDVGGNKFTEAGTKIIGSAISGNMKIVFARMNTVLLKLDEIRDAKVVDLSLPKIYTYAIDRCVEAVFDTVSEQPDVDLLRGDFLTQTAPLNVAPIVIQNYMKRLSNIVVGDYRFLARDMYRSVPPGLHRAIIERVAKRLSKFAVDDPGQRLDLPGDKSLTGTGLVTDHELLVERLYLSLLSPADIDLIGELITNQNDIVEEVDFRGMPLIGEMGHIILKSLYDKPTLKSLNLTSCFISHPSATEEILGILLKDNADLREMRLKGNPAFRGTSEKIWDIVGKPNRKGHPDIVVDPGAK